MVHIKRLYEFAGDMLDTGTLSVEEISSIFEDGIKRGAWWESIKEKILLEKSMFCLKN